MIKKLLFFILITLITPNKTFSYTTKVNSIKIDYMDGSKYEFKKEDIEHVVKYARVIGYIGNEHPIKYVNKLLQNW